MICPTCKGGKTLLKKEKGKGCYEVVLGICDKCHGTGEVEMTNEEWLRTLPADERVKEVLNRGFMTEKRTAEEFVEWLKEIHNEMS